MIILLIPPKNSAGVSAMLRWRERPVRSGKRVPRSPSDPEISEVVRVFWRCFSLCLILVIVLVLVWWLLVDEAVIVCSLWCYLFITLALAVVYDTGTSSTCIIIYCGLFTGK